MAETKYEHIYIDDNGTPFIKGKNVKIIEIISEYIAYGWSPEEIQFQHRYLTMGQIYSAFAYYWDNMDKMNNELSNITNKISSFRSRFSSSLLQNKLKAKKAS